jgi:hypothetical protein
MMSIYISFRDDITVYPYSPAQLRRDNPGTSFPDAMSDALLAGWGVYPVEPTTQPEYDPSTQRITEGEPEQVGDVWAQTWIVTDLTPEEITARLDEWRASMSVTPLQIRRALLAQGLLDDVTAFVEASSYETRMAWEYAIQIDRTNELIAAAAASIGASDAEVDDLFRLAATL